MNVHSFYQSKLDPALEVALLKEARGIPHITDPEFNEIPNGAEITLSIGAVSEFGNMKVALIQRRVSGLNPLLNVLVPAIGFIKNGKVDQIFLENKTRRDYYALGRRSQNPWPMTAAETADAVGSFLQNHPDNRGLREVKSYGEENPHLAYGISYGVFYENSDSPIYMQRWHTAFSTNLLGLSRVPSKEFESTLPLQLTLIYQDGEIKAILPHTFISYGAITRQYQALARELVQHARVIHVPENNQGLYDHLVNAKVLSIDSSDFLDLANEGNQKRIASLKRVDFTFQMGDYLPTDIRVGNDGIEDRSGRFLPVKWLKEDTVSAHSLGALIGIQLQEEQPGRLFVFPASLRQGVLNAWDLPPDESFIDYDQLLNLMKEEG